MSELLDGLAMRAAILEEVRADVLQMKEKHGIVPGLVTILVGENPASVSYVSLKVKTALGVGFHEVQKNMPADVSEADLLAEIDKWNHDPSIHGILVQMPLPKHIDPQRVIMAIDPAKDVDGFHPLNLGRMLMGEEASCFAPCTPLGIQEMLVRSNTPTAGADIVIVGRSNLVGRPLAVLLGQKGKGGDATVTLAHSKSKNLAEHCLRADVLVAAVGVPKMIKGEWVKPGAVVIDVGVNRIGFNQETKKAILSGDVDFDEASKRASKITPVPGGVGPMTIALLMKNTLKSATMRIKD